MENVLRHRIAIVGNEIECQRVMNLLHKAGIPGDGIFYVFPGSEPTSEFFSCSMKQLPEIISLNNIQEVIFCAEDLSSIEIIGQMVLLKKLDLNFKIASPNSMSVIGSNSSNSAGDIYALKVNPLNK